MLSTRRRTRAQRRLLLMGLGLALYYFVVYRPLSRGVSALDAPLTESWRELVALTRSAAVTEPDYYRQLERRLESSRDQSEALASLRRVSEARMEPDTVTRARMNQPFQLIEFQNERQTRIEELYLLAGKAKVGLGSAVASGFPEYLAEQAYPELLWPQLQVTEQLVSGAIHSGVSTVAVVRLQPVQFHRGAAREGTWLAEVGAEVELSGPAGAVAAFLSALPLRGAEIKALGLPEASPIKPVLFIRDIVLRKEGRETPDRVRLELKASTFVRMQRPSA